MSNRNHEFTAEQTFELLQTLDERLRARGVAGAVDGVRSRKLPHIFGTQSARVSVSRSGSDQPARHRSRGWATVRSRSH